MARWMPLVLLASGALLWASGCDTVLGLGHFDFDGSACSGPSFDDSRLTPFLLADGALPPLPDAAAIAEGGADGGGD